MGYKERIIDELHRIIAADLSKQPFKNNRINLSDMLIKELHMADNADLIEQVYGKPTRRKNAYRLTDEIIARRYRKIINKKNISTELVAQVMNRCLMGKDTTYNITICSKEFLYHVEKSREEVEQNLKRG